MLNSYIDALSFLSDRDLEFFLEKARQENYTSDTEVVASNGKVLLDESPLANLMYTVILKECKVSTIDIPMGMTFEREDGQPPLVEREGICTDYTLLSRGVLGRAVSMNDRGEARGVGHLTWVLRSILEDLLRNQITLRKMYEHRTYILKDRRGNTRIEFY